MKKALVMMIESDKDSNAPAILLGLLHVLNKSGEVSAVQMTKGFARIGNLIEDLSLDVPNAKERFEEIKKMAHETERLRGRFNRRQRSRAFRLRENDRKRVRECRIQTQKSNHPT